MMIDTAGSRFQKAVAIADQAGQWAKCRTADGRKAYGVPSQRVAGQYHLTTQTTCTCYDGQRRTCKHIVAVQIHCARMAGKPMPASDIIDGLEQMVEDRHPVLTMVRHDDGDVTWERTADVARAARYDVIFPKDPAFEPLAEMEPMTDEQARRIFGKL